MKGKFNQEINNRLLFRLVQFFLELQRLKKECPEEVNAGKLDGMMLDARYRMGDDISNYIVNNIFSLPEAKGLFYPKFQFEHGCLRFQFILN